jgi:RecJ-like exonuclease
MNEVRCYSCHGRKTILGYNHIPKDCHLCKATGLMPKDMFPKIIYKSKKQSSNNSESIE